MRYDRLVGSHVPGILLEHCSAAGPQVLRVRGSLLVSSLQSLRELGLFERYASHLPAALHDDIVYALASSWLPCALAMQHYAACEAMELADEELVEMGKHVASRIMGTFVATLLRGSRAVGANARPVMILQNYHRLWDRLLEGGTCKVELTGMKDASIESGGVPMFRYRYFRTAYAGLIRGAGSFLGSAIYTKVLRGSDDALKVSVSWV